MPRLLFLRHGQAGDPRHGGYDGLSPLGQRQATKLGQALQASGLALGPCVVGPLERQKQTARLALAEAAPGRAAEAFPLLDEHHSSGALAALLQSPPEPNSPLGRVVFPAMAKDADRATLRRAVVAVIRGWALGELPYSGDEPFPRFRLRVAQALDALRALPVQRGEALVAFTSGGFIGAVVAHALGLDDGPAIDLGLAVDNASLTELHLDRETGRLSLKHFNSVAHLAPDEQTSM